MDVNDLENKFSGSGVGDVCLTLALFINKICPEGREKNLAITKLEEAVFWANAAIDRQGK